MKNFMAKKPTKQVNTLSIFLLNIPLIFLAWFPKNETI